MASSSSRKYPYPSNVRVGDFVHIKLCEQNHYKWRPMMLEFIRSNGLIDFIDGTIIAHVDNLDYEQWKQSDELVRGWISEVVVEEIYARVAYLTTANALWTALECLLARPYYNSPEIFSNEAVGGNLSRYLPLYHATLKGDWETAVELFKKEQDSVRAKITATSETVLLIAVRTAKRNHFVKNLLDLMLPEDLLLQNCFGSTALHVAAVAGNTEAAKWLVNKNPLLPNTWDKSMSLPLHGAAIYGCREMFQYLMSVTKAEMEPKPFEGVSGLKLVHFLIDGDDYDFCLSLLRLYPSLAQAEYSPLQTISLKESALSSGTYFNPWRQLIYNYVPINLKDLPNHHINGDIENPGDGSFSVRKKWDAFFWGLAEKLVSDIKWIKLIKIVHRDALQLVKHLCMEITKLDYEKARVIFGSSIICAAGVGHHEVVEEILASFPTALYFRNRMQQNVFHVAVANRHVNVFNLIYQFQGLGHLHLSALDLSLNNALHMVGYMESVNVVGSPETPRKLLLRAGAAGAALQMQLEVRWYKEVRRLLPVEDEYRRNTEGKTPFRVFLETHEELAKEGEQWMKERANSCTIVAALVATVVFAAAITVPGGNNGDTGLPIFSNQKSFILFAVFDSLALFTSTFSMLTFLSVLNSRYGVGDFLYTIPIRFIIGLVTLTLSVLFTMIAFSAIVYLMFGEEKKWVLGFVSASASIPMILHIRLQFRPLIYMIRYNYGWWTFRKQSDRILF